MNRAVDRIMQGVKTPEGKIIAILLVVCLSLMTWNISAISFAVNRDDGVEEVTDKAEDDVPALSQGDARVAVGFDVQSSRREVFRRVRA